VKYEISDFSAFIFFGLNIFDEMWVLLMHTHIKDTSFKISFPFHATFVPTFHNNI